MTKVISYKFLSCEVNHGTKEEPNIEQIFLDAEIICHTEADYEANLPIAEKEAFGALTVEGEFDNEAGNATTDDVLNTLLGVTE